MNITKHVNNLLWPEWFWLPEGYNWTVFSSTREQNYPDFHWIYFPIPLSLLVFGVRIVFEKYVCSPIGRSIGISDRRPRAPLDNPVLEAVFRKKKRIPPTEVIQDLSKRVDLTSRQVERWFRQRKAADSQSQLQKFNETGWRFFYYTSAMLYGFWVLYDKPWFYETKQCWLGYPYHPIDNDVFWYYMIPMSFYWSLLISQFFDVKRKDFWQMFAHHVTTILLLVLSWVDNLTRVGTLVLLIHDVADVFLEAAKLARYANRPRLCDALFGVFAIVWIVTRLVIYPYAVVYSAAFEGCQSVGFCFPAYWVFNSLLIMLQVLHFIWTWYILRIAINSLRTGKTDDARSDTDEDLELDDAGDTTASLTNNHTADKGGRPARNGVVKTKARREE
ncbi:ceramide synthase 6-like [Paramacrobiotus metropolitanus]|uniref:ceramide synthase 6-like n=1 Tax=Paramacrobiotus metropolitanus TaxID=2943436 RepID=UPI00244608AE|nr:ceramide synthase 6-like [Paramacrobiotus metropolitanus]